MSTPSRPHVMALSIATAFALPIATTPVQAQGIDVLEPVIITAPAMNSPLSTRFDPRAPQQPLPANDGASLLKAIPGMSVIRKGGTDGDPVFRGMAASRLNILVDGEQILGGCGMRMDPPTAYIFPDAFDKVTLLKGPQSVTHGPGGSAATVLLERQSTYFEQPGWRLHSAITAASADRHDEYLDLKAGNPLGYVQGIVTHAQAGDYADGDGRRVHAAYNRRSLTAALGWTPDPHTRLELSALESHAKAAYGDRSMDGAAFDRRNVGLKFEKSRIGPVLDKIEAQLYDNYVDHVMDNVSLRTPPASNASRMASNPDRQTTGGRLAMTLRPNEQHRVVLGLDQQDNTHTVRKSGMGGELVSPYTSQPRLEDARFGNLGVFGEVTHLIDEQQRVVAGLRRDRWEAQDQRQSLSSGMMNLGANPTAGLRRHDTLHSGFLRYEHDLAHDTQALIGIGHTQRAPDYWELVSKEGASSISAFGTLRPEKTTQIDVGMTHLRGPWQAYISGFVSQVKDYILIQTNVLKPSGMGTRSTTIARNIDASTWGAEGGVQYAFHPGWTGLASLAYVHGHNDTDGRALGQIPPLEARLGLDWQRDRWTAGGLLRLVAAQHRYAIGDGNIVGQDLGRSHGFAVASLHGGYRWSPATALTFGIDNLFDQTYAEAISRGGAAVMGYEQTTRINEPGRTVWLKLQVTLE